MAAGVTVNFPILLAAVGVAMSANGVGPAIAVVHEAEFGSGRDPFQRVVQAASEAGSAGPFAHLRVGGFVAVGSRHLALLVDDAGEIGFIVEQGTVLPSAAARVQELQPNAVLLADLQEGASTWVFAGEREREGEGSWLKDPPR